MQQAPSLLGKFLSELTMPCVYALIFPNGKRYIGISKFDSPENRFKRHCSFSSRNRHISKMINKHGKENIKLETIVVLESFEQCKEVEITYIEKYQTLVPMGYNLTKGGDGTLGHKFTAEQLKKLSDSHKGIPGPRLGKPWSEEMKIKLSLAHKDQVPPNTGRKWSKEVRKRMSDAQKKRFESNPEHLKYMRSKIRKNKDAESKN